MTSDLHIWPHSLVCSTFGDASLSLSAVWTGVGRARLRDQLLAGDCRFGASAPSLELKQPCPLSLPASKPSRSPPRLRLPGGILRHFVVGASHLKVELRYQRQFERAEIDRGRHRLLYRAFSPSEPVQYIDGSYT